MLGLKILRKIHLWLGLTCGLLASVSGLSGALYVWQPELTFALNPRLLKYEGITALSENQLKQTASALIEKNKQRLSAVKLPYREQETLALVFMTGKVSYFNPSTGEYLGDASASMVFFENLLKVHRTLLIPKYGKYIMGGSAVIFFLLVLVSGVWIWYKAYGANWRKGLSLKLKSKKKRFQYDLHKFLGIVFFIPLLILAFTGAYFTFHEFYKSGLGVFDNNTVEIELNASAIKIGDTLTFKEALYSSEGAYALREVRFPKQPQEDFSFRFIKNRFIQPGWRETKELKLNTSGVVTLVSDFARESRSNRMALQFYPIHLGELLGFTGRILVFISGLIPVVLYWSGFKIYLNKKRRPKKKAHRIR